MSLLVNKLEFSHSDVNVYVKTVIYMMQVNIQYVLMNRKQILTILMS